MKYETTLLKERKLRDLIFRTNVMIEDGWTGDGEVRTDGSFYLQFMKRLTRCAEDTWE